MWTTIKLQHRFINKKNKFDHFLILEYSGVRFKDGFEKEDPRGPNDGKRGLSTPTKE